MIVGSQKALADKIGVVQSAVANWLRRGNIPAEHCLAIEIATQRRVTRQQLRPKDHQKIWGVPDKAKPKQAANPALHHPDRRIVDLEAEPVEGMKLVSRRVSPALALDKRAG